MAAYTKIQKATGQKILQATRKSLAPDLTPSGNRRISANDGFWAKLTGSTAFTGSVNRWYYAWTEQRRTATAWENMPSGRSSTDGTGETRDTRALNATEANNTGSGVEGNGVDRDSDYPTGLDGETSALRAQS